MKPACLLWLLLLLLLPARAEAAAKAVEEEANFSLTVPKDWIYYSTQAPKYTPEYVKKAFDATDIKQPELYLVGWKETGGRFVGAFAVTYVHKGMAEFTNRVLLGSPEEQNDAATGFSNVETLRIRKGYETNRGQKVVESSMDFLRAEDMFVALSDAVIDTGGARRIRSATYYFRGDSMIGVITLYNEGAPAGIVADLENLPTTVIWKN